MHAQTLKCLPYQKMERDTVQVYKRFRIRTNSEPLRTNVIIVEITFCVKRNRVPGLGFSVGSTISVSF